MSNNKTRARKRSAKLRRKRTKANSRNKSYKRSKVGLDTLAKAYGAAAMLGLSHPAIGLVKDRRNS